VIKVIINADDFGYSRGANYGILDTFLEGALTSTTLLANMPATSHAIELAKKHKGLGVGVHLTLTCGRPLCDDTSSLTDHTGAFRAYDWYARGNRPEAAEVEKEWRAQIEKIKDAGVEPTHLDTHHHINRFEPMRTVMVELARFYGLPVRNNFSMPEAGDLRTTDLFVDDPRILLEDREKIKARFKDAGSVEIMCHPAYLDKPLLDRSDYTYNRTEEAEGLMLAALREKLSVKNGFKLISYHGLE